MKTLKVLLYVLVIAGAVAGFGWFFVSQLGTGRTDRLAGVLLSPPPGYEIAEHGELAPTIAAAEMADQLQRPPVGKVGIRFQHAGGTVYWLADVPGDFLEELASGPNGTRLQTVWRGRIRERLSWAREHGDFAAPGLPAGERKNLYH
ncbi:MAG: hypothetical protein DMF53_08345 [Acidobacteria bacterium]|nr:MAG: hypothetical protein DMF53_08345 [Acidobacteriota bacterium]